MIKVCIKIVEGGFIVEHEEYPMGIQKTFVRTELTEAMLIARNVLTEYLEEKEGKKRTE